MLKIKQQGEIPEIVRVSLSGHFTSEYVPEVEKRSSRMVTSQRNVRLI
jgi:hypothetical protein